ncbi:MAG: tetratricopeptide repeat protein, partial [Gemmatimonadetes bacterium]|nr:tetratricopeptide repeat protein [Gemmatimonadota bacterium]
EAFQQMLVTHPLSSLVPDALYGIAESYAASNPDSADAYYREVATNHAESMRAASAMYKLGTRAQRAGDLAAARRWFERVHTTTYRGTDEYALAGERLRALP